LQHEFVHKSTLLHKISKHLVDIDASSHLVLSLPTTRGHGSKFL